MTKRRTILLAVAALVVAACSGSTPNATPIPVPPRPSSAAPSDGIATTAPGQRPPGSGQTNATGTSGNTSVAAEAGWRVDTSSCPDPEAATAPIGPTVRIALVAPITVGVPAAAWKATVDGFQEAITRSNLNRLLAPVSVDVVTVDVGPDPRGAVLAVQPAIDNGAQVVVAAGDDVNLDLRFTLNEQCIPQVVGFAASPELGAVTAYPWTMAIEPSTDIDVRVAGTLLADQFPGGGTIGVYTSDDARGGAYRRSVDDFAAASQFDVVAEEVVLASASAGSPDAVDRIAAARPDVVMASTVGLDCAVFVRDLSIRRNRAPDWRPVVVVDSTCATPAVLGLAGPGADALYSTSSFVDPVDPANAGVPGVHDYVEWMTARGLATEIPTAVQGWTAAETLLRALQQATAAQGGLTRASIVDAMRALDVTPSLGRPGIVLRTAGSTDQFAAESAQVVRWDAQSRSFMDVGPVVTQFES